MEQGVKDAFGPVGHQGSGAQQGLPLDRSGPGSHFEVEGLQAPQALKGLDTPKGAPQQMEPQQTRSSATGSSGLLQQFCRVFVAATRQLAGHKNVHF